jgi:prepilin-type N-terminal cleavage/methylation domain-containing protein
MKRSRRAVSLIELLVVMSVSTVLITLTSGLVCRVMRIQVQSRAHVDVERNTLRLSNQFRRDVHQAQSAVTNRADLRVDVFLMLRFADGEKVEYSSQKGIVLRLKSGAGAAPGREEYVFPPTCELTIAESGAPPRLVLTITGRLTEQPGEGRESSQLTSPAIPVTLQVESQVGHDLRFGVAAAQQEAQP